MKFLTRGLRTPKPQFFTLLTLRYCIYLFQPTQETLKLNLDKQFAKAIPKLLKFTEVRTIDIVLYAIMFEKNYSSYFFLFQDDRCESSLTLLAAHLSPKLVPSLRFDKTRYLDLNTSIRQPQKRYIFFDSQTIAVKAVVETI